MPDGHIGESRLGGQHHWRGPAFLLRTTLALRSRRIALLPASSITHTGTGYQPASIIARRALHCREFMPPGQVWVKGGTANRTTRFYYSIAPKADAVSKACANDPLTHNPRGGTAPTADPAKGA